MTPHSNRCLPSVGGRGVPLARPRRTRLVATVLAIPGVAVPVSALVWESLNREDGMETTTWAGTVPSVDGSRQQLTLTLFPDSTFRLRRTDVEGPGGMPREVYELGRWQRRHDEDDAVRVGLEARYLG